jgi:hypothetical protein
MDGKPLVNGGDLPTSIRVVGVEQWRDELYRRDILDKDHSSPREDFRRLKDKFFERELAAERDGQIWAV